DTLLAGFFNQLNNPFPGSYLDSSFLGGFWSGIDTLTAHLPGFGLTNNDQDTLLGELDNIGDIFGANFDSLGGLFGQYQSHLQFDSFWAPGVSVAGFDTTVIQHFNVLQDTLDLFAGGSQLNQPGGFANLIDKVFNAVYFPDLELAFGIQNDDLKYWALPYKAQAKVLRLGSVPRFDNTVNECHDGNHPLMRFPVEARWHVQGSFLEEEVPTFLGDKGVGQKAGDKGIVPLVLSGDFAMMLTPQIGVWGKTTFRLITSLGMEFGTYAPAHRDYDLRNANNEGYATGYGPQAGVGFSMATGGLVIYSLGTVAHGDVLRCALPYRYDSRKFEVGMRCFNVINCRYSTGLVSWQENDNRRANIENQFTIGIILSELHH
ncbi:MAG: hypothetical protein AAB316_06805, partial [Bacteroidota bacterium]